MTPTSFVDVELSELALMLTLEEEAPTYRRDLLERKKLDFSIESLKHIDSYLEELHLVPPQGNDLHRVALRCGAYVGEVMRKLAPQYHWLSYDVAAQQNKIVSEFGRSMSTAAVLWRGNNAICFPLAKVCKFVENGNEDSVHFFAKVILANDNVHV